MKIALPIERLGAGEGAFADAREMDRGFLINYTVGARSGEGAAAGTAEASRTVETSAPVDAVGIHLGGELMLVRASTVDKVLRLCEMADVVLTTESEIREDELREWRNFLTGRMAMVARGGANIYHNGQHGVDRNTYLQAITANPGFQVPRMYDTMRRDEFWTRDPRTHRPGEELTEEALIYLDVEPEVGGFEALVKGFEARPTGEAEIDQVLDFVMARLKRQRAAA